MAHKESGREYFENISLVLWSRGAPVRSDWVPVGLGIQSGWVPVRLGTQSRLGDRSDKYPVRLGTQSRLGDLSDWVSFTYKYLIS